MSSDAMADRQDLNLRVPFPTLVKIGLFVLLAYVVCRLYSVFVMVFVAILLAVVLSAATEWLERRGVHRVLALVFTTGLMFAAFLGFVLGIIPSMVSELQKLAKDAPRIEKIVAGAVPAIAPYVHSIAAEVAKPPDPRNVRQWAMRGVVAGQYVVGALTTVLLVLVLSVYLVVEGRRAFAWLISFAPEEQRKKLARTGEEVQPVMLAYMRGQLITSTLSAIAALAVLLPFHVPAALALAALAFIGDFIPVVGFIASLVPAVLLALLRGPGAALAVIAVYFGYQALENYVITPRVYGRQMEISTLTVMLCITIGGVLMGPIGAILLLPVAAAYPAIEHIWLRQHLPEETVPRHDAMKSDSEVVVERATEEALKQ